MKSNYFILCRIYLASSLKIDDTVKYNLPHQIIAFVS
jgi:hypothetical protein